MTDYMVRATAANDRIRAFACCTSDMVEQARRAHDTSPVATAALGRLLTGGAMMGTMMKGDHDLLTLQITGDGPKRGGYFNGVCALWGRRDFAKPDNPGSLIIWAWGLMRGLDLAERIPEIDAARNVVIGSSRLGKAALLAAAYDERFKVCVPNQTGAVGVQLMKRDYGESLKGQRLSLPHWYCRNIWKYAENPVAQPFDQHLLIACVAPRALLLECYHKKWFDPKGEWLAAKAASPAWELLTGKALGGGDRPPSAWPEPYSDVAAHPPFGYVRRTECHGLSPYDWKWALDFAESEL